MRKTIAAICAASLALGGCATASKDVTAAYVSPNQYANYDCEQLFAEAHRLNQRAQQLGARLDTAAANDQAIAGVALLLFWPAAFALGGTKAQEAEYSRLRGEGDAVAQQVVIKKCGQKPDASAAAAPTVQPVAAPAK